MTEEGLSLVAGAVPEPASDAPRRIAQRHAGNMGGQVHVVVDTVEGQRVAADAGVVQNMTCYPSRRAAIG